MSLDPQEILMNELRDIKEDVKAIRMTDIPDIKVQVAGFHGKLKDLEKNQTWSTRLYTILGGAIAVSIAKFTGHK